MRLLWLAGLHARSASPSWSRDWLAAQTDKQGGMRQLWLAGQHARSASPSGSRDWLAAQTCRPLPLGLATCRSPARVLHDHPHALLHSMWPQPVGLARCSHTWVRHLLSQTCARAGRGRPAARGRPGEPGAGSLCVWSRYGSVMASGSSCSCNHSPACSSGLPWGAWHGQPVRRS